MRRSDCRCSILGYGMRRLLGPGLGRARPATAVELSGDNVVLTMTPRRARAVAKSLGHPDALQDEWLKNLVVMLARAAARRGVYSESVSTISSSAFLRGHWHLRAPETAATLSSEAASAAAAVVAEAVAITMEAQAEEGAKAVIVTADAVAAAAATAAEAADRAREARALAAGAAAEGIASIAAQTAVTVQLKADAAAMKLAENATLAAARVAAGNPPGSDRETARTALRLAATVRTAAITTADDTATAAAVVANAVAAAAADVAFTVSATDLAHEREVAHVARHSRPRPRRLPVRSMPTRTRVSAPPLWRRVCPDPPADCCVRGRVVTRRRRQMHP